MDLHRAIKETHPEACTIISDKGVTIAKDKTGKEIHFDLNACIKKAEDTAKAEEYRYLRIRAYPKINDQLDYIYHNGIDKWKTDIVDPVKKKYPKPE